MKIVVCVKTISSQIVGTASSNDWVINPYDLYSMKQAKQFKTEQDEIICIILGRQYNRTVVELKSLGADRVIFVTDSVFAGSDTFNTSLALAKAIEKIGDVSYVLCGEHSLDGETGQVGPETALRLGYEFLGNVSQVEQADGQVVAKICNEQQVEEYSVKPGVVIAFNDCITTEVVLSLMQIRKIKTVQFDTWDHNDIMLEEEQCGTKGAKTSVVSGRNYQEVSGRKGEVLDWNSNTTKNNLIKIIKGEKNVGMFRS